MASFKIAEEITGRNEGQYANNPADNGGETYAGIARNFWGNWDGWVFIDAIKMKVGKSAIKINKEAKKDVTLTALISKFYKQNFWDALKLDLINDQQLANSVYDFGVNSGTSRSAKMLQTSYNEVVLSNSKLIVDGMVGKNTIEAINAFKIPESIYNRFNKNRESFYRSIAKGSQAQFLNSWLSRLKPYKK